jgi:hypothetical protein
MRRLARELGRAVDHIDGGEPQLTKFLAAWSRARRHWCEVTGSPLI